MEFFATCPKGLEGLLAAELRGLGCRRVRPLTGRVAFEGTLEEALVACMWSRLASRVELVLGRLGAASSDELYEGVAAIPWEDHLPGSATFAFDARGANAALRNTGYVAERCKDAVADRLLSRTGARPRVDAHAPDVPLSVRVSGEKASVGLVLSGAEPLFRRGYEAAGGPRGLRADYAAALLALGGAERGMTLAAAWQGDGTLVAEAALVAAGRAPGLLRRRWGFDSWLGSDAGAWGRVLGAASEAAGKPKAPVLAFDPRSGAEQATRRALVAAGLAAEAVRFVRAGELARKEGTLVVADLAWPHASLPEEAALVSPLCAAASAAAEGANLALVGDASLAEAALGRACDERIRTRLGNEDVDLALVDLKATQPLPEVRLSDGRSVPVLVGASDQFAARLAKVARLRSRWARRELVSCYRVYDADLPDYNVAIDLLEGAGHPAERHLAIAEYAAPAGVDAGLARRRLMDVLAVAPEVLGVAPENVSLTVRTRSRGGSQYAAGDERHTRTLLVEEGGLVFELNLGGRHDYGIFLDQRDTRSLIREMTKAAPEPKRFLNLFGYTGTATVYAADGGARLTTTVDLSRPSLDVARRNMRRNGFGDGEHAFVRADVLRWVDEQRHARDAVRYDLVFCDVPTFSNSARMRGRTFDVQRDHAELLIGVSRLLSPGGVCVFSCNLRSFKPDVATLARAHVAIEDITEQTIPQDFSRTPKVHRCYLVGRT